MTRHVSCDDKKLLSTYDFPTLSALAISCRAFSVSTYFLLVALARYLGSPKPSIRLLLRFKFSK